MDMKIKIKRVWDVELDEYKNVLDKYNPIYNSDEHYALIKINDLIQLFSLAKELEQDLIISQYRENQIEIYDDYIE
jgi:hypothetical protein